MKKVLTIALISAILMLLVGCPPTTGSEAVVHAGTPVFSGDLANATYVVNKPATLLNGTATVQGGGTITYQWYSNTTNSSENGTAISGATFSTYTPPTDVAGIFYYYVIATNTISNNGDGGIKTATKTSTVATITVNEKEHAVEPVFKNQFVLTQYGKGSPATPLDGTATVTDGGTITYQWYSNTIPSNSGGSKMVGETNATYTPPTNTLGDFYYYVEATNTIIDNGDGGNKTAKVTSIIAIVTVDNKAHALKPQFSNDLTGATYGINAPNATALNGTATTSDGGTMSYQWYSNTTASNQNGSAISGARSAIYTPPTNIVGTFYYYVIATNTLTDNGDGGQKTASATSNVAKIDVLSIIHVHEPVFSSTLVSKEYKIGYPLAVALDGTATITDNGTLTYQWYKNTTNSSENGSVISGATDATYTPPTDVDVTFYYYVVATNTITDNGDGGKKNATKKSTVAEITIDNKIYMVKNVLEGTELTISPNYESTSTFRNFFSTVQFHSNREEITKIIISMPEGATIIPGSSLAQLFFHGYDSLTEIVGLEYLDTSSVTTMQYMFSGCSSLTELDLSSFDTSSVTNMNSMFLNSSSLTSITFGDSFNTSSVSNMGHMFEGCSSLTSLDLSSFVTSLETYYGASIFYGCDLDSVTLGNTVTKNVSDVIYPMYNRSSSSTDDDIYPSISDRMWVSADGTETKNIPLNEEGTHAVAGTYTAKRVTP